MSLQLVVSNPPKSNKRRGKKARKARSHKKRRKMSAAQKKFFSKRRAAPVAKRKSGKRRRSSRRRGGGLGSILGGGGGLSLIPSMATVKSAAASVGGFYAVNKAVEKLQEDPTSSFRDEAGKFPWKTVGIKIAVAAAGGALLGKTVGREMAQAFTIGGMTAAGLDVLAHATAGTSGMGYAAGGGVNDPAMFSNGTAQVNAQNPWMASSQGLSA